MGPGAPALTGERDRPAGAGCCRAAAHDRQLGRQLPAPARGENPYCQAAPDRACQ